MDQNYPITQLPSSTLTHNKCIKTPWNGFVGFWFPFCFFIMSGVLAWQVGITEYQIRTLKQQRQIIDMEEYTSFMYIVDSIDAVNLHSYYHKQGDNK